MPRKKRRAPRAGSRRTRRPATAPVAKPKKPTRAAHEAELQAVNEELETAHAELQRKVEGLPTANGEEALRAAREQAGWLASFPARNPLPIAEVDTEGRVRYANAASDRLFPGLRREGARHPWLAGWDEVVRVFREEGATSHERNVDVGPSRYQQIMYYVPETGCIRIYGIDVAQRKRVEADRERLLNEVRLRAAELDAAFDSMADGVILYGRDGNVQKMNKSAEELFGFTSQEWAAASSPEARAELARVETPEGGSFPEEETPIWRALRGATSRNVQMVVRTRAGTRAWVLASAAPIRGAEGEIHGAVATFSDITERRRMEDTLRDSEQRYSAIHDEAPFAIALTTVPEDTLVEVNEAWERLFGYTREEALGKTALQLGIVGDPDGRARLMDEMGERGSARDVETSYVTRSGERRVLSGNVSPVVIGGHRFMLGTVQDITDRKRAQEALVRSRQGLSRLAEASLRVVRETALDGMLQAISEAALALTGARIATCGHGFVSGRFMVGGSARAPGAPACPPGNMFLMVKGGVYMELVDGAEAIRVTDAELRAHPRWWGLPEGHVPMRGMLGVRMAGRGGQPSGMILVTDKEQGDFTDEDESLLRQLGTIASLALQHVETRISLEEADRSKNEFLAMLSHELRNPLAPIRNSLYVIDRAPPGGEQARRAQAVIERQVVHMTRLVDDLLDVTRISRGKIQLQEEPLELGDLLRRAGEDHRASFANGGLELEVSVPEGPIWVRGDRTRLVQVVGNLLENAAKFTPPGGNTVVSLEENASVRQAILRVRDTGAGIAPEMLPRLFEPFTQADTSLDRTKGGLGLGLTLVKGLVEMHGGKVSVASEGPGKGAEFTVLLPLAAAEGPAAAPPRSAPDAGPLRVLVIEDNVDAAETLREVLEMGRHTVEVALSGAEGLEKARRFGPDVVLCDIGLPGMDGYEIARAFRSDPALRDTKIVALTGYASPADVARSRAAGFDVHLAKPPSFEKVEEALAICADGTPRRRRGSGDPR